MSHELLINSCPSLGTRSGRRKFEYYPGSPTIGNSNPPGPLEGIAKANSAYPPNPNYDTHK